MSVSGAPLPSAPGITDIRAAAGRIRAQAVYTPLLESPHINRMTGGRVLVKAEPLQRTGSFKFRGAYNTLSQLTPVEKAQGVVAYSSGNHAQGVALAANLLGIKATILMPADAPAIKIANTRFYGAEVVTFDRYRESREELGARLCADQGATLVKPYDDPRIIAGQGTVGLEITQQLHDLAIAPDAVVAPCGGGGLISGLSLALKAESPDLAIYSAEPENFDDTALSLTRGEIVAVDPAAKSICDALMAPQPGALTFSINKLLLSGGLVVCDSEVRNAMRQAFYHLKLVVEPGGAVALAALLSGKLDIQGKTAVAVCSGGNVDAPLFAEILAG